MARQRDRSRQAHGVKHHIVISYSAWRTEDLAATELLAASMPVKALNEGHERSEVRLAFLGGRAD